MEKNEIGKLPLPNGVVAFTAKWCAPCKIIHNDLNDIKSEFSNITIKEVDVDKEPDLVKTFSVRSVPTLLFIKDSKLVKTILGAGNKKHLRKTITELFK